MNLRPESGRFARREFLKRAGITVGMGAFAIRPRAATATAFRLATFSAEVTVPMGHALMGGGIKPAERVVDLLLARGFALLGGERPLVLVSVDWCEIRNDAFDRWRTVLAEAAGTSPDRVLVTSTHCHDAPVADLRAQRLLDEHSPGVNITDLAFHESAVQRVASALREGLKRAQLVTHIGTGEARVEGVASNRRFIPDSGGISYARMSRAVMGQATAAPEGTIDPFLKTVSFWNGNRAVCSLHSYATHPMSHYGQGQVSCDFVGLARNRRQADDAGCFQIYASGCSGNVTAGKFNDGSPAARTQLTQRIYDAMVAAEKSTERHPLCQVNWRASELHLTPRSGAGFSSNDSLKILADPNAKSFAKCLAAMNLSWRERVGRGQPIGVPVIDFGPAQILLLPAESYVEFQLFAQWVRPEIFTLVAGYGECAPGYIPIEKARAELDSNLHDWCWVDPGAESAMKETIVRTLKI
ncbi:MAG: hypothetical protein HY301_10025 [Verrucomicrobia bacterium]|nr:hypothetical protein [Verrucomicrobiota bacterium]